MTTEIVQVVLFVLFQSGLVEMNSQEDECDAIVETLILSLPELPTDLGLAQPLLSRSKLQQTGI